MPPSESTGHHRFARAAEGPGGVRRVLKAILVTLAARASARPAPPAIRILTYHRVNDSHPGDRLSVPSAVFTRQMEVLAYSGRPVVTLGEAVAALRGDRALPPGAVALTFDDGFADNLEVALPVLQRFELPAIFFVPSALIGGARPVERYLGCCGDDRLMDWEEVQALVEAGHDVGGHGRTHLELADLPAGEAREEIEGSRREIAERASVRPRFFCYPRGSQSPEVRRLVQSSGYEAACTVQPGANAAGVDLFGLLRTEVAATDDGIEFEKKLAGDYDGWHRMVQGIQRLKDVVAAP